MTRPIYEPNPQRQGASLEFGQQQLYRRPAPVSSGCGCPWDTAFMQADGVSGTTTVNNNTLTDIVMTDISIASGSAAFAPRSALNSERPLKALLDGWYIFFLNFEWSGGVYADVRTYSLYINNMADNDGNTDIIQSASSPLIDAAFNATYGPLYFRPETLSDFWWKIRVQQASGGNKVVTGVLLTCMYLGPDLDPGRMPPF